MWDCATCGTAPPHATDHEKRIWHCGWMDESEWQPKYGGPSEFGDEPYDENVCPGYLLAQPLVGEIVSAWRAFEKGNWDSFYGDAPAVLFDGVSYFSASLDAFHSWEAREAKRKRDSK